MKRLISITGGKLYEDINKPGKIKQNDDTVMEITLFGLNGDPYDPDAVTLVALRPDNTRVVQNTNITINGNVVTIVLDMRIVAVAGEVNFELKCLKDGEVMSTFIFSIKVDAEILYTHNAPPPDAIRNALIAAVNAPYIGTNGNWFVWDSNAGNFADSGVFGGGTNGRDGTDGRDGRDGRDGTNGNNAREVDLREYAGYVQWRLLTNGALPTTAWQNLYEISSSGGGGVSLSVTDERYANAAVIMGRVAKTYAINDASPFGSRIYGAGIMGESVQNGTPTRDVPVPIVSADNPYISINGVNIAQWSGRSLRQIGGVRDVIEYDGAAVNLIQRVERKVLDGSEANWTARNELNTAGFNTYQVLIPVAAEPPDLTVLCSHFAQDNTTVAGFERVRVVYTAPNLALQFTVANTSSIGLFKSWLSLYNVTVLYKKPTAAIAAVDITGDAASQALINYTLQNNVNAASNALSYLTYNHDLAKMLERYRAAIEALGGMV